MLCLGYPVRRREKGEEHERYEQLKQAAVSASFTARLAQLVLGASIGPEDLADRANTQLTGLLMLIFIGLLFVKQYIFKPIQVRTFWALLYMYCAFFLCCSLC